MATMPLSITDQEISPAEDLGDRTPREDTEEIQPQETVSTLRDAHEEMTAPEIPAQGMDDALPEENQEIQVYGTDDILREETQDTSIHETDNALRDETPAIPAPVEDNALHADDETIHTQSMDNTPPEYTEEMQPQETHNAPLDAMLNDCRVEMVPLDDIYAGSDPYDDALNDDLIKALAHSISLIGLQNPICIVVNDIPDNTASYRLVSGRKRYAAFLQLERPTIPAHILSYAETDREQDVRKALATTEENLVRKHYSLIELCELVGQAKEIYERIHPEAQKGKAPKRKHSGTESLLKPLAYLDVAAQQLGKSRATVWKYIHIYTKLIQGHHYEFIELKQCDHPILSRVEDLLALAQSDDIEVLTRLLCGLGFTPDDRKSKPCTLQEAQKRLEEHREKEARAKDQSPVQEQENAAQSKKAEYTERGTAPPQPEDMRNGSMKTSSESEEVSKPAEIPEKPAENDLAQAESQIDLQETIGQLAVMIDQYLTACNVFKMFDVRIRKQRNTKGRNRLLITIQE